MKENSASVLQLEPGDYSSSPGVWWRNPAGLVVGSFLPPSVSRLHAGRHAGTDNMGTHVMFCNMELVILQVFRLGLFMNYVVQATYIYWLVNNMLGQTTYVGTHVMNCNMELFIL